MHLIYRGNYLLWETTVIDKGKRDNGFIWNHRICEFECDKSCDIGEYLDYANCTCRKRVIDKLVEKCGEDINENKTVYNTTLNGYGKCILAYNYLCAIHSIINHDAHNNYGD